jgi:hypothetical protein
VQAISPANRLERNSVNRQKVFLEHFSDAIAGWIAGVLAALVLGLIWPFIFPAFVRVEHYYGAGPSIPVIMGMVVLVASLPALLGGLVGGALAVEGGDGARRMLAIVLGILFSIPCSVWGYWFFTGY